MKKRIIAFLMCALMAVTSVPLTPVAQLFALEASAATTRVESLELFSTLTGGKLKMTSGTSETVKVMVQPSNATNKTLKWSSSAKSIVDVSDAEVSSSGVASVTLTAGKEGTAKVTYSTTDGSDISGTFTVVVSPLVETLKLNQYVKSITPKSEGERLIATVSPSNAGNQKLMWFSSDDKVCKVDYDGVLYPVSVGECKISVATTDGSDLVKTCRVVVGNKANTITIDKKSVTVENGKTATLYATVTTTDGTKHDAVKWTSSNTKVATVSSEGKVTAKYPGTATIKATTADGTDKYASCTVTVTQLITKITLPESVTVGVGTTKTITAKIEPTYATDTKLTWTSDNTSVATVSTSGVVTAHRVGTAKITCKSSNSKSYAADTCTVKVVVPANDIIINSSGEELWKNDTVQLSATVSPSNATDKSVTWSTSNSKVATVSSNGLVTAIAGGTCTVTATNSAGQKATCLIEVFESATGIELDEIVKVMYVGQVDKVVAKVLPSTATNRDVTWYSSNKSIASVEVDGTIKALKVGECTISAKSVDGGYVATCKLTVNKKIDVTGIALDKNSITLNTGKTFQLLGSVSPNNASEKRIKWSSDNTSVATVSSTGVVKGVKAGSAIITATSYDGNYTAKCKVTVVQPVTGINLTSTSAKIAKGKSKTLTWNVFPDNASDKSVTWSSSNTKVATVSKGVITAVNPGSAVITVKSKDGGFTAACNVTVYVPVTGVSVSVKSVKVPKGETRVVTAVVTPSNATTKTVKWTSSNKNVAKVSSSGKITGVAKGTATITAKTTDGSFKATCKVTVIQLAEKVTLDASYVNLQAGKYKTLVAKVSPSSASSTAVKWKSSNKKVAEVSSKGVVKAIGAGICTITAISADGNAEAKCKINVIQPPKGIKLDRTSGNIRIGKTATLTATVLPKDATNKKVTWISSNEDRATVTQTGKVKGISQGYVTITAKTADGKYSASCKVLVVKGVTGVKLDKQSITMNVGKSTTIVPTVSPKDATIKTVTWSSSNNDVATVDKNGKVTAKGAGYATITAKTTDGSFKAKASVLVIKPVTGVTLNKKSAYLDVGEKLTLKPKIAPSDASVKAVTWTTSNKSVATVSSSGVVKGIKKGEATITCTTNNGRKVASCKIYVVKRVTDVTLSHSKEILYFGDTLKLRTTVYPTDATVKTVGYYTSDEKIATVSSNGVVTPLNVGTVSIVVVSKDGSHKDVCKVTVKKAPEGIRLGATSVSLKAGQSKTIKYAVYPADATNRKATFTSSNTKVVKVSSSGKLTAVSKGTATITAKTENGLKAYLKVTVKQHVTSVEVDPAATVYTGKTLKLYASVIPKDAENKTLRWRSSDTSVVKVTSKGVITGMRAGSATITVTSAENSKLRATCKVTVKQHVTSLKFAEREIFINKGTQADLKYTLKPADATNKKVTFKSSAPTVISVTGDGRITALKGGSATITVTSDDNKDIKSICYVTAVEPAAGVSLNYKQANVFVGGTVTLKATVSPSDAHNKLVRWSSDSAAASVDSKGVVTALKSGTATITVTTVDGGYKATCKLNLLQRATSIKTDKTSVTVERGETCQLNATVLPEDCYNKSVMWISSNPKVASVTDDGLVTALAPGKVTLICKSLENGISTTVSFTVHEKVTDVDIEEEEIELYTPLTKKLSVTVLPENASDKSLAWTSSDEKVARVDKNGVVTAVGKGEAIITAKSNDTGITDTCKVTAYIGVEDIITDKNAYSLYENTSIKVGYTLNPAEPDIPDVTFTSSDETIFTVADDGTVEGLVPGNAELIIASVQNPDVKRVVPVSVTRAVTGLELELDSKVLYAGESYTLNASVLPSDATDKTVIWSSDNSSVVSIDSSGKLTAVARGFAEITAKTRDGGFEKKCTVEVIQLPEKIDGPDKATAYMGKVLTLGMTVLPEDTNDKTLSWTSSDESVATVDGNGKVTPVKPGTCDIIASSVKQGVERKVRLTVVQLCREIRILGRVPDLFAGQRVRVDAEILPADTTDKRYEWYSTNSSVATVDSYGVITAVKPGKVDIVARSLDAGGVEKAISLNVVAEISSVRLEKTALNLEIGTATTLKATVEPEMAYDKSVTWSSSDSKTVSVDSNGKITGHRKGRAIITVKTSDGKHSAKVTVTVIKSAEDIRLYRDTFNLKVGNRAMVEYEILPADTTQTAITWTSSDSKVVTVDSYGVITAVGKGSATVTLTVTGTSIRKSVSFTIS